MRNPAFSIIASIWPACPSATASGLMIANVCSIAMFNSCAALQTALNLFSDFGGGGANSNPRVLHRLHFVFRFSRSARNDRARVAHSSSWRRGLSGDESNHRLLDVRLDVLRRGLLGVAADLADHHDGVRIFIFIE